MKTKTNDRLLSSLNHQIVKQFESRGPYTISGSKLFAKVIVVAIDHYWNMQM